MARKHWFFGPFLGTAFWRLFSPLREVHPLTKIAMKLLVLPLALLLGYAPRKAPTIELKGYFACRQSLLVPTGNAFVCYASAQRSCQNGTVVLAYEKLLSNPTKHARFAIIDTVKLQVSYPNHDLAITTCTGTTGKPTQYFVLFKADGLGEKYLRHVQRVWGVSAQGRLVEVPVNTLKCLNQDTAN